MTASDVQPLNHFTGSDASPESAPRPARALHEFEDPALLALSCAARVWFDLARVRAGSSIVGLSAARALFLAAFAGAIYVSLRPVQRVERALDFVLSPARVLGELAAPIGWLHLRSIRAAESALSQREQDEFAARLEFDAAERRAALPTSAQLRDARRFVHATVVGRREEHFDNIVIEPDGRDTTGLEIGMPVTSGDVFVGRIVDFDASQPGRAFVELLTGSEFTVGAVLDAGSELPGEPARLVAGGLVTERRGHAGTELAIAVHNPSRRNLPSALVRVDESFSVLERFAAQARGFELGWLEARGEGEWFIRPRLDYRAGVFQVVVVCPPDIERASDGESEDVLFDGGWRDARVLSRGEPTHAREGLKVAGGTRVGAAVVAGVRLVGLVAHVAPLSCDVRTLGDPGLAVPVVARVDGLERPLALGRLVALGRTALGDGATGLAFQWDAVVPCDEDESAPPRRARLFTASGAALVPRGLLIGDTELPAGRGARTLLVRQDVDVRDLRTLWLRASATSEQSP